MAKTQVRGRQIYINDITGADLTTPIGVFDETKDYSAFDTVFWNGNLYQVKPGQSIAHTDEGDLSNSPTSSPDKWIKATNIRWYHYHGTGSDISAGKYLKLDFFYYAPSSSTGLNWWNFLFVFKNNVRLTPGSDFRMPSLNYAGTCGEVRETIEFLSTPNASDTIDVYYYEYTQPFVPSLILSRQDGSEFRNTKIVQRFWYDDGMSRWSGYLDSLTINSASDVIAHYKSYDGTNTKDVVKKFSDQVEICNIGGFTINTSNSWAVELWRYGKNKKNKSAKRKFMKVPVTLTAQTKFTYGTFTYRRGLYRVRLRHVTENIVTDFSQETFFLRRASIYRKGNVNDQFLGVIEWMGIV